MKFWAASRLAEAAGMPEPLAYELRTVRHTGVVSEAAMNAAAWAADNGAIIPQELPLALPPNPAGIWSPIFLREPTFWEFAALERAGFTENDIGYYFFTMPCN